MSASPDCFMCAACREQFHGQCFGADCRCPCVEPDEWDMREEAEATRPMPDLEMES